MRPQTLLSLIKSGRLRTMGKVSKMTQNHYRCCFLVAAQRCGLLGQLNCGPMTLKNLCQALSIPLQAQEAFRDWLQLGADLGELQYLDGLWRLSGSIAQALAKAENDDIFALLEEVVDLHGRLILNTPQFLRDKQKFTLKDQDGSVIARSSKVLVPFVCEAIDKYVPTTGTMKVLEIGCGSGVYMNYCMKRNSELTIVGLELQPEVALMSSSNLKNVGQADRSRVEIGDIRSLEIKESFDLITMHNNIYYFEVSERVDLFRKIHKLLCPGGRFLLTTGCRGGSAAMSVLNIWGVMTKNCGGLPWPDELVTQLGQAGFTSISAHNLTRPVDSFYSFSAIRA